VHTETDEIIRVISMRKATKHEERGYYAAITN
ncbi:MAG TPA: BrnT family toxin, partial [Gammaproteobacteria bacterium]|nr:BrnT family toxin [Gammaproteobacteria bacterium]